jgi:SAM-dependent methyltransferase
VDIEDAARAWDVEYEAGRYRDEAPVAFVDDILTAARDHGLGTADGLYIGCGNGRNYLPLRTAGLDLTGLDISAAAIAQLTARMPADRDRLVHGDLAALPTGRTWPIVIGIQVFQHGDRTATHAHLRAAQRRLRPGGLFCLRVNAVGTDVWPAHEVVERDPDSGFTVRYTAGSKQGLLVHFFAGAELDLLFEGYTPVLPRRLASTRRTPPAPGQWAQWEAIYRSPANNAAS